MFEKNIELYEKYDKEFEGYFVLDILQNNPTYILFNTQTCKYKTIDYYVGVKNFNTFEECLEGINQSYISFLLPYNEIFKEMLEQIYSHPDFSNKLYVVDFIYSVAYIFVGVYVDVDSPVYYYIFSKNEGKIVMIEKVVAPEKYFYEKLYEVISPFIYEIRAWDKIK